MQKLLDLRGLLAHSESNLTAIQQEICIEIGRCCHFAFYEAKIIRGRLLTYTDRPYLLFAWHSDYNKHGKRVIVAIVFPNIFLTSIYTLLCYIFLRRPRCLFKRCFAPAFCANRSVELFFCVLRQIISIYIWQWQMVAVPECKSKPCSCKAN